MTEPTSANIGAHELEIPVAAYEAGRDAYFNSSNSQSNYGIVEAVVRAVAPLIVATELRRMANGIHEGAFLERLLDDVESETLIGSLSYLRQHIDHLDPEGLTRDR